MSDSVLRNAFALSAALHGLVGMWVEVRPAPHPAAPPVVTDAWAGRGIEVEALPLATADLPATPAAPDVPAAATPTTTEPAAGKREETARPQVTAPKSETGEAPSRSATAAPETAPRAHTVPAKTSTAPPRAATPHEATAGTGRAASPRGATASNANGTTPTDANAATASDASGTTRDASAATSASGAAFGAAGLPPGVRHLPKAFTRALSIADRGDPRWLALPAGPAGEARVELPVDEDGKLGELSFPDAAERDKLAPVIRHLLENTRLLLESGHFSLDPSNLRAGVERLRVRVEVVERPAASEPEGDPNELKELEYEPPARGKPGRGSFALNSGRRVIGWVYLE